MVWITLIGSPSSSAASSILLPAMTFPTRSTTIYLPTPYCRRLYSTTPRPHSVPRLASALSGVRSLTPLIVFGMIWPQVDISGQRERGGDRSLSLVSRSSWVVCAAQAARGRSSSRSAAGGRAACRRWCGTTGTPIGPGRDRSSRGWVRSISGACECGSWPDLVLPMPDKTATMIAQEDQYNLLCAQSSPDGWPVHSAHSDVSETVSGGTESVEETLRAKE